MGETHIEPSHPCDELSDRDLVARFEALELPPRDFGHREHVRLAFAMLAEAGDFGDAAIRYRRALRAFATHVGAHGKYHETLTWAYLAVVHERMYQLLRERHDDRQHARDRAHDHHRDAHDHQHDRDAHDHQHGRHQHDRACDLTSITSFDLLARFPDLLDHRTGALARYYDIAAVTRSDVARAVFVLPERA